MAISQEQFCAENVVNDNEVFQLIQQFSDQFKRLSEHYMRSQSSANASDVSSAMAKELSDSFQQVLDDYSYNPSRIINEQMELMQQQMLLWQRTALRFMGQDVDPVIQPEKSDRRFSHEFWDQSIVFDYLKQNYLLQSKCLLNLIKDQSGIEDDTNVMEFVGRQFVNAMSPTNFAMTNPEVLDRIFETKGENLSVGMEKLLDDLEQSSSGLNVTMTDVSAFKVGENVAATPGKVVFENRLFQLLQYTPKTDKVFKTPLLIVPPFINKYYILDLGEKKSLVKWLVEQGHTVFMMSWVNPGPSYRDVAFDDYLTEGTLAAIDAIKKMTGEPVNTMGYCVGGTLLACTLAYLAEKKNEDVKSATYLTTLIDFTDPGEIGVFISEDMIQALEKEMQEKGYFDGRTMAFSFNLLRENDLFWSFFINNYLKADAPKAFDLLYWNTDGTNLPGCLHGYYLRNMYLKNLLKEPGGLELAGVKMDLSKVQTPSFFLSTVQDHIAKWKSTYSGVKLVSGNVKFVLSGSGHIAGVVNPPAANKYGYWENENLCDSADEWFENAQQSTGSWWPRWQTWVEEFSGERVDARQPGTEQFPAKEDAPGRYVTVKIPDAISNN